MLDKERKLIITRHVSERASQFNISIKELINMFWESDKEPKPPNARPDRDGQFTLFRRHGTCVMVVGEIVDKHTKKDAYLLLTIFDQKMYLDEKYIFDEK